MLRFLLFSILCIYFVTHAACAEDVATPALTSDVLQGVNVTDAALSTAEMKNMVADVKTGAATVAENIAQSTKAVRQKVADVLQKHGKTIALGAATVATGAVVAAGTTKYNHHRKVQKAIKEVKLEAEEAAKKSALNMEALERWEWLQKRTALRAISTHDEYLKAKEVDAQNGKEESEASLYWSIQDAEARALADAFSGERPKPVNIVKVEKEAREKMIDDIIFRQEQKQRSRQDDSTVPLTSKSEESLQEVSRAEVLAAIESMAVVHADATNALTDDDALLAVALEAAILHDFPGIHPDHARKVKSKEEAVVKQKEAAVETAVLSGVEHSEESTKALFAFVDALNAFEAAAKEADELREKLEVVAQERENEEEIDDEHFETAPQFQADEEQLRELYKNIARDAAAVANVRQTRRQLDAVREWMASSVTKTDSANQEEEEEEDVPFSQRTWASTVSNPFSDKYAVEHEPLDIKEAIDVTQEWCDEKVETSGKTPSVCKAFYGPIHDAGTWYADADDARQDPYENTYVTSDALTTWLRGSLASSEKPSKRSFKNKHSYSAVRL